MWQVKKVKMDQTLFFFQHLCNPQNVKYASLGRIWQIQPHQIDETGKVTHIVNLYI